MNLTQLFNAQRFTNWIFSFIQIYFLFSDNKQIELECRNGGGINYWVNSNWILFYFKMCVCTTRKIIIIMKFYYRHGITLEILTKLFRIQWSFKFDVIFIMHLLLHLINCSDKPFNVLRLWENKLAKPSLKELGVLQ
jgi:hypothetical protein